MADVALPHSDASAQAAAGHIRPGMYQHDGAGDRSLVPVTTIAMLQNLEKSKFRMIL